MSKLRRRLLIGSLIAALFVFYFPIISQRAVILWDTYDYSYPLALLLRDSIRSGIFPLWNPFILSGEAMFAQPAVSAYHPFHLLVAIAPEWINSLYFFELLIIALPFIGAAGAFRLFRFLSYTFETSIAGGAIFGLTFVGPLLGQMSIAYGVCFFPWLARSALILVRSDSFDWRRVSRTALLGALFFWGTYFGIVLYAACFLAGLIILSLARNFRILATLNLGAAAILVGMLVSPHLLPAAENRSVFYSNIDSSFVSPDPRVRGVTLPEEHVVDIIPNERTLIGILLNSRELSQDGAFWFIGPGYSVVLLLLASLMWITRKKRIMLGWLAFATSTLYVLGPKSIVFDLVFEFIPLLGNIRYPAFAFPFLMLIALFLALFSLDRLNERLKSSLVPWVIFAIMVETLLFASFSGLFSDRAPNIVKSIQTDELASLSLQNRNRDVAVRGNRRSIISESEYQFGQKDWLTKKVPSNHGYSTADSPLYWNLKSAPVLSAIAYCPTAIAKAGLPTKLTNSDLHAAGEAIKYLPADRAFGLMSEVSLGSCKITNFEMVPGKIRVDLDADAAAFLVVNDKNYPGWTVRVDEQPTSIEPMNFLFKGVRVSTGPHQVEMSFEPRSFITGIYVALAALSLIFIGNLIQWRVDVKRTH